MTAPQLRDEALDRCRQPLEGANPCGADLKRDPEYQKLRTEIQKLTATGSGGTGVDWALVKEGSVEILSQRSKDLTIASYLAVALFVEDGYGGLADGLAIVETLLADHWDGVHPTRLRAREMALQWLVGRLSLSIESRPPLANDVVIVTEARSAVQRIQESVAPHFSRLSFRELREGLSTAEVAPSAPSASTASVASEPSAAPGTPTGQSAAPPPPASKIKDGATTSQVQSAIRALVEPLRQADSTGSTAYRLLRILKWDGIAAEPQRIDPPRPERRAALETLLQGEQWSLLLDGAEAAIQSTAGTFWLDLQRFAYLAARGLFGEAGEPIATAITSELARLLDRLPRLVDLEFSDGTPFASDETRAWIEAKVLKAPEPTPVTPAAAGDVEPPLSADQLALIRRWFADGKTSEALECVQQAVNEATGSGGRFLARLAGAEACLSARATACARALLEGLVEDIDRMRFEDWDPQTAVRIYQLLASVYAVELSGRSGEAAGPELRLALQRIRSRASRLDVRAVSQGDDRA